MNKFSKYAGLLAVSFFGMFAMNSCDDSKDYGDFSVYDGQTPDVYFPTSTTQVITAGETTRDFVFNVYRASTDAPATVSLSWSGDVAPFTLPTSASFDANSVIAPVKVEFISQELTPQSPYNLTVSIAGTEMTELTQNYLNFQVTYYPMSEWEPFGYDEALGRDGQGYYVFSQYYAGTENPVQVLYSYSLVDPKQMEFQFQWLIDNDDPSLGWETFLTAESSDGGNSIVVPEQPFASHSTYGTVYVSTARLYNPAASSGPSYFDSETGTFYLDLIYYVSEGYFGYGYETCVLNGYMDTNDYTVTLADNGAVSIADENYQIINFTWTDAVQMVLYTVVETSSLEDEEGNISEDILDELAEKMMEGEVDAELVEDQGNLSFSFPASGNYTVVALGIAPNLSTGQYEAKSTTYLSFQYTSADPNAGWTSLGMVEYTDAYMCAIFNVQPITWEVEMQENDETPGLYRLVNPYGEAYPYNEPGDYDPKKNSYLIINAEDPEGVYIPESPQSLDWGYGSLSCFSMAGNYIINGGYDVETVKAAGYCGTLKDGLITFPAKTLLVTMADLGGWYYANAYGEDEIATFCVDMNSAASSASAKAKSKSAKVSKGKVSLTGTKADVKFSRQAKVVDFKSKAIVTKRHETFRTGLSSKGF